MTTLELLNEIQATIANLPMGGIGPDGATQEELDEASENGHPIFGDANYHAGQQVWLLAERAKKILQNKVDESDLLR